MTTLIPYPAPSVNNKSGTINVQFGSYFANFGQLGSPVGNNQYTGRLFCEVFTGLPTGIYNLEIKRIELSLPQGHESAELLGGTSKVLPNPTFLLDGDIFSSPLQQYNNFNATGGGGIIINADSNGIFHHSTGTPVISMMKQLNTTVVYPNWKSQYVNLASNFIYLNLRIRNKNPTNNLSSGLPSFWYDEPVLTASGNPNWNWLCIDGDESIEYYPANSKFNLFNVSITIEYNTISTLPAIGI